MEKDEVVTPVQVEANTPVVAPVSHSSWRSLENRKSLKLVLLALLAIIIPLTVLIAKQNQDLRQHASDCGITCPVNGVPVKYTPADGSSVTTITPYLTWDNLGAGITYQIFVRESDPNTGAVVVKLATPANGNGLTVPASAGLVLGKTYYWNVQSCKKGICSAFGPWFRFITSQGGTPNIIKAYLPIDGTIIASTSPRLSWYIPQGATPTTVYTVALVDLNATKGSAVPASIVYAPGYVAVYGNVLVPASEGLLNNHRYAWNVKACNGTLCSYPNNSWVFTLALPTPPPVRFAPVKLK